MDPINKYQIFLIDALGAVFSVLCLSLLFAFEDLFGMPKGVLSIFISTAVIFAAYSFTCYFARPTNWKLYLSIIAILNISYSLFTVYYLVQNSNTVTWLGYLYFIAEVLVIWVLSGYELKLSTTTRSY